MDIYSILSSKPHNPHYLNRYIKFIENCIIKNQDAEVKTHKHHICPRAPDMFPEHGSFQKNPWNLAKLSPRQHFIAHLILWKAYPTISSAFYAVWQMKHKNKEKVNSRLYDSIILEYATKKSEKLKGFIPVHDKDGKYQFVSREEYDRSKHDAISSNRVVARDKNGNYLVVNIEEFKLRNDLVGATQGMKIWNNGIVHTTSNKSPGPDFVAGMIPLSEENKKLKNTKRLYTLEARYTEEEISSKLSAAIRKYWANIPEDKRSKSEETKKKMSIAALKNNPGFSAQYECPCCGKKAQKANISKHHGLDGSKCRWSTITLS